MRKRPFAVFAAPLDHDPIAVGARLEEAGDGRRRAQRGEAGGLFGRAFELAMDECLAKGVTSLTDAGAGADVIALYRRAAATGKLRIRLYVMAAGPSTSWERSLTPARSAPRVTRS